MNRLIVIRGNSCSGKTTVARTLHPLLPGCALVEQDHFRRMMLREKPGGLAPRLIESTVQWLLDHDRQVILEGILFSDEYQSMLVSLMYYAERTHLFYLDVRLEETLRRNAARPEGHRHSPDDMRAWFHPHDVLGFSREHLIGTGTVANAVDRILSVVEADEFEDTHLPPAIENVALPETDQT